MTLWPYDYGKLVEKSDDFSSRLRLMTRDRQIRWLGLCTNSQRWGSNQQLSDCGSIAVPTEQPPTLYATQTTGTIAPFFTSMPIPPFLHFVMVPILMCQTTLQMSTKGKMNFIKQDEKKGKMRYVGNIYPHHGYIWNYGAFPQVCQCSPT